VTTSTGRDVADQWRASLGGLDATQHVITGVQVRAIGGGALHVTANVVGSHVRDVPRRPDVGGRRLVRSRRAADRRT
jgi:hypothetical protein